MTLEAGERGARGWSTVSDAMMLRNDVTARWMMGYPCLWRSGRFFAGFERATGMLVVKVGEDRAEALLADGTAAPFMPNGRPFRAWIRMPADAAAEWNTLVEEAYVLAGGSASSD